MKRRPRSGRRTRASRRRQRWPSQRRQRPRQPRDTPRRRSLRLRSLHRARCATPVRWLAPTEAHAQRARRDRLTRRLGRLSPRCKRCPRCRPSSCSATATRYPARRAPTARIAPAVRCAACGPALTRHAYALCFFSHGALWSPFIPTLRRVPTRPPCCSTGCAPAAAAPRLRCADSSAPGPRHESAAHPLPRRRLPARPEAGGAWRSVACVSLRAVSLTTCCADGSAVAGGGWRLVRRLQRLGRGRLRRQPQGGPLALRAALPGPRLRLTHL
jgi:hypothetical protein